MRKQKALTLASYGFVLRAITVAACVASALPGLAQDSGPITQASNIDHANTDQLSPPTAAAKPLQLDVELALANVTVTDPYNRLVTGLDKEHFRVFEDGTEQEVLHVATEDIPISIGLIMDMSGSMEDKVVKARQAAVQFLKTANPRDEFFLVTFNDRARLLRPFTTSFSDLQNSMLDLNARGRTALFDGIYLGLSEMRGARNNKRALLIISDGGDNHSRYSQADIENFVREADCQIYTIGVYDRMGRTREELYGPTLLSELANITGGRMFRVNSTSDLPDIAGKIGMQLRNQYVVGYKPSNEAHDGSWRKIRVRLVPPRGLPPLRVYAKTGYYAPHQ